MEGTDRHNEWSYFSAKPKIHQVRTGDSSPPSSSSSREAPTRMTHHRPPTPPFPSTAHLPSSNPAPFLPRNAADHEHHPKGQTRHKSDRHAYAHFLSRLRDEEQQEPPPRTRSRSNSSGASALLRLLAHETARADAAERALAKDHEAVISRVRSIKEAQLRAEAELARATAELALYKLQLEIAQREILRAQTIVDDVERARVEAEERAIKDRERIRKLVLERSIEVAREEGRREGWRMGLERGRLDAWATEEIDGGDVVGDEDPAAEPKRGTRSPPERSQSSVRVTQPAAPRDRKRSSSRAGSRNAPDVSPFPIAAPTPILPPTAQQGGPSTKESSGFPNDISVFRNADHQSGAFLRSPPHPPRPETRSPSLAPSRRSHRSHRSVPPDGYIPTLGPDAHIALPPPHELSRPVDLTTPADGTMEAAEVHSAAAERENGKDEGGNRRDRVENRYGDVPTVHGHAYKHPLRTHSDPSSDYDDVFRVRRKDGRDTPALSTVSRVSTRISQYDIVSPPKAQRAREERHSSGNGSRRPIITSTAREEPRDHQGTRKLTPPEKIVEDWRSANSEFLETPSPKPGSHLPTNRTMPAHGDATRSTANVAHGVMERSTMANAVPNSPRVRPPRGPRQPMDAPVTPRSNPQSSIPGSYIYSTEKADHRTGQTRPATQPPSRPSSVANIYRQPTASPHSRPASSLNTSPPSVQRRSTVQRSISNVTVPGIDVEPPSHSPTNPSEGTVIDPILLTPEHANQPTALPDVDSSASHHAMSPSFHGQPHEPIIVSQLPPGFVPLSPIPTMTNFKSEAHDHSLLEQSKGPGYQIYAGAALMPEPPLMQFPGMPSTSGLRTDSILFGESPRPSTAAPALASPRPVVDSRKRVSSFGDSPAPLNRPFSIFDD